MKNLQPFTPQGCDKPVALVSPNCSQLVLDVLENNWDKSSSGFGSHIYVEDLVENTTDPEILQEYWEEYSLQRDAEYQILTLFLGTQLPNCSQLSTMFNMFITVPTRTSAAIESLKVDLLARKALVTFVNGYEYEYENVSARAIANVLFNPDISLGFWVNNNCINANRSEVVGCDFGRQQYEAVQLPSFV